MATSMMPRHPTKFVDSALFLLEQRFNFNGLHYLNIILNYLDFLIFTQYETFIKQEPA